MFGPHVLDIDSEAITTTIVSAIRQQVTAVLRRRGGVLGLSGGVDSSVVAALCARALGPERVLALFMPERDSSPDALRLGRAVASTLDIEAVLEDIGPALDAAGCYRRQEEAIREVFPEYAADEGWRCKLTLPPFDGRRRLPVFRLTVESTGGEVRSARLPPAAYRKLVAATNFKQRLRKTMEYYHADRLGYAVAGTPNRLEYDQGFFVKHGDGAADFKPIAHLYKTQVYQLAAFLGLPDEVCSRPPTTDTFSMPQTQEEFYFSLPYGQMDLCLYAHDHGVAPEAVGDVLGLTADTVRAVYGDIEGKRRATRHLHEAPLLVEPVR